MRLDPLICVYSDTAGCSNKQLWTWNVSQSITSMSVPLFLSFLLPFALLPFSLLPLFLISIHSKFSKYLDLLMPAPRIYSSLCGCSLNIRIPGVLDHYGHWVYVWFLRNNLSNISKHSALVWLAHTNFSIKRFKSYMEKVGRLIEKTLNLKSY